ncbi:MAG TPA: efflux RND transporter periplasmic adaptor subunit [Caulifigura sp.]|nr:efflux RND transporter periplasmic adaptor subunit [Caulifigura sp.]
MFFSRRLLWLVPAGAVAAATSWLPGGKQPAADTGRPPVVVAQAPAETSDIRVTVVSPKKGGLPRITTLPCAAHWFESADLFSRVSGYVKTQSVDIGSKVKQGEVVAELETPELDRDVDLMKASQLQARAEVLQMQARRKTAEAELKAAEATVAKSQADVARWVAERSFREKEYERFKQLGENQSVQAAIVDEKLFQFQAVEAGYQSAESAIEASRQQALSAAAKVELADADLGHAKAKAGVADAGLAKAREMAGFSKILSPYDGIVTHREFHRGEFVRAAGQGATTPMMRIARTDLIRVVTQIPDRDVRFAHPGDKVTIEFDAIPAREFAGKLSRIAHSEDVASRTMRAEVDLPNPEMEIFDQMYGRIKIDLEPASSGLRLPSACLIGDVKAGRGQVFVVRENVVKAVNVVVVTDNGREVEVSSGLEPSDAVIVRAPAGLSDGTKVTTVPGTEAG